MLNHRKSRHLKQVKENDTLEPKGMESGHRGFLYTMTNGHWFSAHRWLLRYSEVFMVWNLVNPMHSWKKWVGIREENRWCSGQRKNKVGSER